MIRRPPRSTLDRSSAASDVYKRQVYGQASGFLKYARGDYAELRIFVEAQVRGLELANAFLRVKQNAVSYTHLRAHETVLDLVCRLLLEKKKKNV